MAKFPEKDQNKVIETTREFLSRYLELEEIMGLKNTFINPSKGCQLLNS